MVAAGEAAEVTRHGDAADLELLLVDGDNLLHAVRGRRDEGGTAWLLPRLARWRPERLRVIVVLDGHPAPGEPMRQRALGIELHHAGSRSADDAHRRPAGRPALRRALAQPPS